MYGTTAASCGKNRVSLIQYIVYTMSVSAHTRDEVARVTSPMTDDNELSGSSPTLASDLSMTPAVMKETLQRRQPVRAGARIFYMPVLIRVVPI